MTLDAVRPDAGADGPDRGASRPEAPSVPLWPVWRFGDYARLAEYVTPTALQLDPDLKAKLTLEEARLADDARDRVRAERLFGLLREQGIQYDEQPWAAAEGVQQVRHPWWVLSERYGNCLDLSLLYAGMCLVARAGVLLALGERHAFVALTPGRLHAPGARDAALELSGFARSEPGVLVGKGAALSEAIGAGHVEPVDLVEVAQGSSFEEAVVAAPGQWERGEEIILVDVPYLQAQPDFAELPHPASHRPSIRLRVPAGGTAFREFGAHAEILAELRGAEGRHALIGDRGRGKSTIARHLAESAPDGAAWFLDASDRKALCNSLAAAMFDERPRAGEESLDDPAERKSLWETARAYLREKERPWLVVLDNADGDPATLRDLVPEPGPGQMVLVTSIDERWARTPGFTPHELGEVGDADLGEFGHGEMGKLIRGRPLLLDAFERLAAATSWDGRSLPPLAGDLDEELRGPAAYWELLREGDGFEERQLRLAGLSAYLPANGHPTAVLEALVPASATALERLVEAGLLARDRNAGEVRMHRLFGAAIRRDLEARLPETCDELVLALLGEDGARAALDRKGDPETVTRLDRRLAAIDDGREEPDAELGVTLQRVAELLELHGSTRLSGKTYARAERHLQGSPRRLADCLQGRARTVNQHHARDKVMVEEAIGWAKQAHEMLLAIPEVDEAEAARCYAMQGLLMMKALANEPLRGKAKLERTYEALAVIEEADRQRQESDRVSRPEKARSTFNLAGPRIQLAQQEPGSAELHLNEAQRIYREVGEVRRELYGRMNHPHIAACENGLGLVGYYRALLVPADREQQTAWLREATEHAAQALKEREILDGSVDFEEAPKSAALLAKIALARNASPVAALADVENLCRQATGELRRAGRALAPASLPATTSGLAAGIEAWARSDALRTLVAEFGGEPPEGDLGELLSWLEEFSAAHWDFRQAGGERNHVTPPQLSLLNEKVIAAAAKALGLVEGGGWRPGRYEQVLVLGGKARACLSRPRFTADLIARGEFEVGAVTALGGFRVLDDEETALVEEVEGLSLTDEHEAMEAGVRHAFGVDAVASREGVDSKELGASWRVSRYETAAGPPVSVVAAPSSEPGVRRANTPDTLAWFATEFANLEPGQRVLMVTTDIYLPFQHADALRRLALPYGVEVDAVGMVPGKVDRRLAHAFQPHNYLQEVRSAVRSLGALHAALGEAG